jgi:NAD(P)H-hydrate epimerase
MQILTAAEMQQTDQRTSTDYGVPSLTLMHNAGAAVARFILRQYPHAPHVLVLCGKGNNGGDGFVTARLLLAAGRDVRVLLLATPDSLRGDAALAFAELRPQLHDSALLIVAADSAHAEAELASASVITSIQDAELIVDAVLGTGFKPPLRGLPAQLRDRIAATTAPIVSVDLPTGWDADSLELASTSAFRSNAVVTFTAPKQAHVFGALASSPSGPIGPIVVADIGSPAAAIQSDLNLHWAGASQALTQAPRTVNANKGTYGHVLVIGGAGGSSMKAGAPAMSSLAALRSGAGLVTALVPESIAAIVSAFAPELMIETTGSDGAMGATHFSPRHLRPEFLSPLLDKIDVLAVGPGLSRHPEAAAFARGLVAATRLPIVLDADALNAFEGRNDLLNGIQPDGTNRTLVLTPHPGEMARLAGCTTAQVESDRIGLARGFAIQHQLTLVLKGWRTLIAHPDGRIAVNTSGNPAMAKGGSGDLLTGIVAALLAQYPHQVAQAVEAAVYLHGLAADYALRQQDEHTLLATDLLPHLWQAFQHRATGPDNLTHLTISAL